MSESEDGSVDEPEELFPDVYLSSSYSPTDSSSSEEKSKHRRKCLRKKTRKPQGDQKDSEGQPALCNNDFVFNVNVNRPSTSKDGYYLQSESRPPGHLSTVDQSEVDGSGNLPQQIISQERQNLVGLGLPAGHPERENDPPEGNRSRKRVRDETGWKQNRRKRLRNSGQSYINVKGVVVPEKKPSLEQCPCTLKCHENISNIHCQKTFTEYYKLDFNLQTSFLSSKIKIQPKQRVYAKLNSDKRLNTRIYCLTNENGSEVKVCKEFFKNVLKVSDGRLTRALSHKRNNDEITPPKDKRGLHSSLHRKTPDQKIDKVVQFISKFPAYSSHYSRKKNPNRKYLSPNLNKTILYSLYKQENSEDHVSKYVFNQVLDTKFNLHFHAPISDSCKKCDAFKVLLQATPPIEQNPIKLKQELHLRQAESARAGMKQDAEKGKDPLNDVTVISFDLMKTLPTPVLSTGIVYYKRQLWTYNLGIHNLSTNESYMYVWDESVASRGPQEIGSSILHFVENYVRTSKLIMYSDQCGGQNRNIKMAAFCDYLVTNPKYFCKEIDHKFLVSGHTYLACDQDFGLIEKQKKFHPEVYDPDDWIKVIQASRKPPFVIKKMEKEDFFSCKKLMDNITNRKKETREIIVNNKKIVVVDKVQWLKMQWLRYESSKPLVIFYKYSNNEDVHFSQVNVKKRITQKVAYLDLLYPQGRKIEENKKNDLISLLDFIPPIKHKFYQQILSGPSVPETIPVDEEEQDDSDEEREQSV